MGIFTVFDLITHLIPRFNPLIIFITCLYIWVIYRGFRHNNNIYIQEKSSFYTREKFENFIVFKFQELSIPNQFLQVSSSQIHSSKLNFLSHKLFDLHFSFYTVESYKERVCDLCDHQELVNFVGFLLPLV